MLVLLALICLVLGVLTSYIKARAEGVGSACDVGIVERTERLLLVLVGTGLAGLGVPYAVDVALWVLLAGGAVTVGQRLVAVRRAPRRRGAGAAAGPRRRERPAPWPRARLAGRLTDAGFAAGWRAVRLLPEPVARGAFDRGGRWAAGRDGRGVRQLRANLRVATGGAAGRGRTRRARPPGAALLRPVLAGGLPAARDRADGSSPAPRSPASST